MSLMHAFIAFRHILKELILVVVTKVVCLYKTHAKMGCENAPSLHMPFKHVFVVFG